MTNSANWHTLFMIADNEPGVLARVTGLFSARGYQIQSLTAGEIDHANHLSCMTITTFGTPQVIAQIKAQLEKIIAIRSVHNLSQTDNAFMRELVLIRIRRTQDNLQAITNHLNLLGAKMVDSNAEDITYELTGESTACDQYIQQLRALCDQPDCIHVARSGITGIANDVLKN